MAAISGAPETIAMAGAGALMASKSSLAPGTRDAVAKKQETKFG